MSLNAHEPSGPHSYPAYMLSIVVEFGGFDHGYSR
jgi:hypothetical protein